MKRFFLLIIIIGLFFSTFISCKKEAGQGGTSKITGKLFVAEYNVFTPVDSFYSGKENIYIIYGDNDYFGDKIESSYDGTFEFPYLKKGKYTIYSYSDCLVNDTACHGGKKVILKQAKISENHQAVDVGDIRIVRLQ